MRAAITAFATDTCESINGMIQILCALGEVSIDLYLAGENALVRGGRIRGIANIREAVQIHGGALGQTWDLRPHCSALTAAMRDDYDIILMTADENGNRLAPLLAIRTGGCVLLDLTGLRLSDSGRLSGIKSVYNQNLKAVFPFATRPAVVSMLGVSAVSRNGGEHEVCMLEFEQEEPDWFEDLALECQEIKDDVRTARNVLVAGRGIGTDEALHDLYALAALLNAKAGCTRPLVQDGRMSQSAMIGAFAAIISPEVCLVFGASGAAPLAAGIENSKLLVGVNSDPESLTTGLWRIAGACCRQ